MQRTGIILGALHTAVSDQLTQAEIHMVEVILSVGETIVKIQEEASQGIYGLRAELKRDGTVVTIADLESERRIIEAITLAFPGESIMSEETFPDSIAVSGGIQWIIDPLDGTRAYSDGGDDFAILISRCGGGEPQFSLVYFPAVNLRELIIAKTGVGILACNGEATPMLRQPVNRKKRIIHGVYCEVETESKRKDVNYYSGEMESTRALIELAKGNVDGVVVLICGHKAWDLAAPMHIVRMSGCVVSDEMGRPVKFYRDDVSVRYIVAASSEEIHCRLLKAIKQNL
jgi:fructose-1,6-bisphosphatase/inositol monophosphatase family enzyme